MGLEAVFGAAAFAVPNLRLLGRGQVDPEVAFKELLVFRLAVAGVAGPERYAGSRVLGLLRAVICSSFRQSCSRFHILSNLALCSGVSGQ